MRGATWLVAILACAGCSTLEDSFHCSSTADCTYHGEVGHCESTGFCSFGDVGCASGQRYGEYAGGALAGACVGAGPFLWRGDYDTGDFSQWTGAPIAGATTVQTPLRQGGYAAQFVVHPGDTPMGCGSCGEIVVVTGPVSAEGAEEWWGWSTYFPSDVHPSNEWTVTTYWEQVPSLCSPPLAFEIDATVNPARLLLKTRGGMLDTTNCTFPYNYGVPVVSELSFDRWYDFVLHVRWSGDPSVGLVELWVDSVHVVPQRFLATSYIGTRTQVKQGFERAPSQVVSRIFHDAMRLGASAEDFGVVP